MAEIKLWSSLPENRLGTAGALRHIHSVSDIVWPWPASGLYVIRNAGVNHIAQEPGMSSCDNLVPNVN
jgi:hypothetical protein